MEFSGFKVIKRPGHPKKEDDFNLNKIVVAMTNAFIAAEGKEAANSSRVREQVDQFSNQIMEVFQRRMPAGGYINIEDIQDQVELALMRGGEHKVARAYVLYREERRKERQQNEQAPAQAGQIRVKLSDDSLKALDEARLKIVIQEACEGLTNTDADFIFNDTKRNLFDGIPKTLAISLYDA